MANSQAPDSEQKQIVRELLTWLSSDAAQLPNGVYVQIALRCLFVRARETLTRDQPASPPRRQRG